MSSEEELKKKEQEILRELGVPTPSTAAIIPAQPVQDYSVPTNALAQQALVSEGDRQVLNSLILDFAQDRHWDMLLKNKELKYLILLEFDGEEPFMTRFGRNMIAILSPCTWGDLVKPSTGIVPSGIITKAAVGGLEVVEKARGVANMSICIAGGGSDWAIAEMRRGRIDTTVRTSDVEIFLTDQLIDKYLSETLFDKLKTTFAENKGLRENDTDVWRRATRLTEAILKSDTVGEGTKEFRFSNRTLLVMLIGFGIAITLVLLVAFKAI